MPNNKLTLKGFNLKEFLSQYIVIILFVVLSLFGFITAKQPADLILTEVLTRFARNTFLVLSLIVPVLAGLGLNFGIVVGAMAAQIGIFCVVYWGFSGITGMLLCFAIATPVAVLFGWLVGMLYNRTKGAEMITGMVLAYFAAGLYQLLFLFIIGGVIPVDPSSSIIIAGGVGVKNSIDLTGTLKYVLDNITALQSLYLVTAVVLLASLVTAIFRAAKKQKIEWSKIIVKLAVLLALCAAATFVPFLNAALTQNRLVLLRAVEYVCLGIAAYIVYHVVKGLASKSAANKRAAALGDSAAADEARASQYTPNYKKLIALGIVAAAAFALTYVPVIYELTKKIQLPVFSYLCIFALCGFNNWLFSTKLGQQLRTVGQDRQVANSSGINVNRTRIIAMIISTVLASWGQIIFLQNIGVFATYGAHTMVGQYAIASLLVGGASVQRAENKNALIGVLLFHTLFVVAPHSANALFGNAGIGEYFRVFVCYGVIAVALAMHAWSTIGGKKKRTRSSKDLADIANRNTQNA